MHVANAPVVLTLPLPMMLPGRFTVTCDDLGDQAWLAIRRTGYIRLYIDDSGRLVRL
jgi:hypothetical protein